MAEISDTVEPADATHRRLGAELFNGTWTLLEQRDRGPADDDRMLHMAHASRFHWGEVGTPTQLAIGEWQCSRVYAVLGRVEPSLHHARRSLDICLANAVSDWTLAFAHEALARAHALAGDATARDEHVRRALAVEIADTEDRTLLHDDLATVPGAER